jgi:aldehyde:ferredoxin oxidoreductase
LKIEQSKLYGYNGKVLRVDLTKGRTNVEEPSQAFYEKYLGGRGFIIHALLRELEAGGDPLGSENKLVFALGPLTGIPLSGCGRNSVGAKSPLTGAYGESEVGGFWGAELKRSGYDAIIFEGAAKSPVYLSIRDRAVEIRDAGSLWGMEVAPTQNAIREALGDKRIKTAVIGPAGERLVRFASIINDVRHAAGRTGMGAVMGSKNLKAIAVRGTKLPEVANKDVIRNLNRWMAQNYKNITTLWKYGTGGDVVGFNLAGNLPTRNFHDGFFDHAEEISAGAVCETFGTGMGTCYACSIGCKKEVRIEGPLELDPVYGGPEYETLAAFGSNCLINDAGVICKAHELCNRYGMDTISTGCTIAFAMECFEKGILTQADTDGVELSFGNTTAMLEMVASIAHRRGFGDLLAEGSHRAAKQIGKAAEECTLEVKGLEIPMHEPRLKKGMGLHYSIHGTGPDHCTGLNDTHLIKETVHVANWRQVDSSGEPLPAAELSPRKVRMLYHVGLWRHLCNLLVLCILIPYRYDHIRDAVSAATGWPMSLWRLMKTTERSMTLMRIFNLREGFSAADDRLPERFFSPPPLGNLKNEAIDPSALADAQRLYYQMLGWNEEGIPTRARLAELDIEWAGEYLDK